MRESGYSKLGKQFIERWSPRAFSPEPIPRDTLMTLFEAARWSPSCFNAQPWHFAYADSEQSLTAFQDVLNDGNRVWARKAPVLLLVFSEKHFSHNDKPNRWADFDTGAAWMALNLQAQELGLYCHGMGGFDQDKAFAATGLDPDKYTALCAVAIGKMGDADELPEEIREREKPSGRKALEDMLSEGKPA